MWLHPLQVFSCLTASPHTFLDIFREYQTLTQHWLLAFWGMLFFLIVIQLAFISIEFNKESHLNHSILLSLNHQPRTYDTSQPIVFLPFHTSYHTFPFLLSFSHIHRCIYYMHFIIWIMMCINSDLLCLVFVICLSLL
jgi:hypothetical protein